MGALCLTNSKIKQRAGFGPLLPMVHHAPFPRVRAWREGSGGDGTAELEVPAATPSSAARSRRRDVAAIVIEPIQGEGGYFPAPAPSCAGLRELCDEHGILLIADEIQSGMGRTGRWWAIEHAGVEPDIVTTAKGIASGMPIGAFIARDSIWTWPPGAHGSTFAGNPVCAAAGLATLDVIEARASPTPPRWARDCAPASRARPRADAEVRDIRGAGLMIGVEFDSPRGRRGGAGGGLPARPADAGVRRVVAALLPAADRGRGARSTPRSAIFGEAIARGRRPPDGHRGGGRLTLRSRVS